MIFGVLSDKKHSQVDVENLTEEQQNVVNFAVAELQGLEEGAGPCGKKLLRVENFSQQVRKGWVEMLGLGDRKYCPGGGRTDLQVRPGPG